MANKTNGEATKSTKKDPIKRSRIIKRNVIIGSVSLVALIVIGASAAIYYYDLKVLPNVYAAGVHLSAKTLPVAGDALDARATETSTTAYIITAKDKKLEVHPSDISLVIDTKATARNAMAIGRRNDFWTSFREIITSVTSHRNIPFEVSFDEAQLNKLVDEFAATVDTPEINAGVRIENGKAVETQGVEGFRINKELAKSLIINAWKNSALETVTLALNKVTPTIKTGETTNVLAQAENLRKIIYILSADSKTATAKQADIDKWISSELVNGTLIAALNTDAVKQWIDGVSTTFNQPGAEARVGFNAGKLTIIQAGSDGRSIDSQKSALAMAAAVKEYVLNSKTDKTLTVLGTMQVNQPQITESNISSLGIIEQVGTGTTSYVGSPENRKHNIATGAAALSGILIKPSEEFSTLKYLGKIDAASGYLPELVIKEDRTTPEFGGGLCQVSTTLFRAAMNTGLKITQRRNHSYRVSYYEPPVGMDATIYEGNPDFRFVNDTDHYILVQSHIEGTKITFDFYGTKDGRTVNLTTPSIYNVTTPPDAEYIKTDTLPYGTTKQTEKAHNGSDASFIYTVYNKDGGTRNKTTFTSHYVPWRARYLVGTAGAPADATYPGQSSSSSPSPTPAP